MFVKGRKLIWEKARLKAVLGLIVLYTCCTFYSTYAADSLRVIAEEIVIPNTEINGIAKDAAGRLWLATSNGVLLYDGYETIPLATLTGKYYSRIFSMRGNRILALSEQEIYCIRTDDMKPNKRVRVNAPGSILAACPDTSGTSLFFCTTNGDMYVLQNSGKVQLIAKTGIPVQQMAAAHDGALYLAAKNKLYRYLPGKAPLAKVELSPGKGRIVGVWSMQDKLMIGSWYGGLTVMKLPMLREETFPELNAVNSLNKRVLSAAAAPEATYIAYDSYSFYRYDHKEHIVEDLAKDHPDVFYGKLVKSVFADGNVIWIGTDRGLIKLSCFPQQFTRLLSYRRPVVSTRSILWERDKVYVASYSGIFFADSSLTWKNLNAGFKDPNYKNVFPNVMQKAGEDIFIGMESPSIYYMTQNMEELKAIPILPSGAPGLKCAIYAMESKPGNQIWLGGTPGILSLDQKARQITHYRNGIFDVEGKTVRHLFYDTLNTLLYAATDKGLYVFSRNGNLIRRIDKANNQQLKSDKFTFVTSSPEGDIWVATADDGVYIFNKERIRKHLTSEDGLCNPLVYGILFDNSNVAWISTYSGLCSYNRKRNACRNYYAFDGLSANEFNHNSLTKDDNGRFYFGGINGINCFNPEKFEVRNTAFELFISGTKRWVNNSYRLEPYNGVPELTKWSSEYSMSVMLGISDYAHLERTSYYYQIEGVTDGWVKMPANTNLLFADGLSYGSYDVKVKAVNYRGAVSSNILHFQLRLLAPFYYQWWFITLLAGTAVALYYLLIKYRVKQEKKIQAVRIKIASDMHDEVGGMLTGIGMYSHNLASRKDLNDQAQQRAKKISTLSRQAISSMRDILWTIDARNDRVEALEDQVRHFVDEMLTPKDIRIAILFETEHIKKNLPAETRQQLYFFAKEAINNIAKHSTAKNVEIIFRQKGNAFHFRISNDGIKTAKINKAGQGLQNMKMRAERLNAIFHHSMDEEVFSVTIIKNYPFM